LIIVFHVRNSTAPSVLSAELLDGSRAASCCFDVDSRQHDEPLTRLRSVEGCDASLLQSRIGWAGDPVVAGDRAHSRRQRPKVESSEYVGHAIDVSWGGGSMLAPSNRGPEALHPIREVKCSAHQACRSGLLREDDACFRAVLATPVPSVPMAG
jgi:hypothetical protein